MITIYGVNQLNEDGRGVVSTTYYIDKEEAYSKKGDQSWWVTISELSVWEKGEQENIAMEKADALAKLTIREKELLGLNK